MSEPRVSVAMGAYNGEAYIAQQLESILAQTRPVDEIIVCDDRSSDTTAAIVAAIASRADVPIRLYKNVANLGYRRNFERALEKTTGDIVFFSDQDDLWLPHKVERVLGRFESQPEALLVYTDAAVFDEATGERALLSDWYGPYFRDDLRAEQAFKNLHKTHNLKGCVMAFRAELKALSLPFGAGWGHDRWLTLLGYALSAVSCLDEPLILHRRHPKTATKGAFFNTASRKPAGKRPGAHLHELVEGRGKRELRPNRYQSLLERLEALRASGLVPGEKLPGLESYIRECRRISDIYETRWRLKAQRRPAAFLAATGLLVSGFYHRHFGGFLSYADDVAGGFRSAA